MIFTAPRLTIFDLPYYCLWLIDPACSCSVTQLDAHRISRPSIPYITSHDVAHANYPLHPTFAESPSITSAPAVACYSPIHARRPTGKLPRLSGPLAVRYFPVYPTESPLGSQPERPSSILEQIHARAYRLIILDIPEATPHPLIRLFHHRCTRMARPIRATTPRPVDIRHSCRLARCHRGRRPRRKCTHLFILRAAADSRHRQGQCMVRHTRQATVRRFRGQHGVGLRPLINTTSRLSKIGTPAPPPSGCSPPCTVRTARTAITGVRQNGSVYGWRSL